MRNLRIFTISIIIMLFAVNANAQNNGAFIFNESDNGNIEFYCFNNYTQYNYYYGTNQGVNISNYAFYVNGAGPYSANIWTYGSSIVINRYCGVQFSKGDKVALYINGQFVNTWYCDIEKPSTLENIYNWIMDNKPARTRAKLPNDWKKQVTNIMKKVL